MALVRMLVFAGAAVLAGLAGTACSGDDDDKATPKEHALRACAAADKFEAAVRRNDDIDTVRRHLNKARREAARAEQGNSLYVGLASGIEALRISIDSNDAGAAKVGMVVVRDECAFVERGVTPTRPERPAGS